MDRKDFIAAACVLCGIGLTVSVLDGCSKTAVVNFTIDLNSSANASLSSVGGYVIANGGNTIVMNTSSGFVALSLICTHNGCIVNYIGSSGFRCPCHGGRYSVTGAVISGPPPAPLTTYSVTQSGSILTIKG